MGKLHWDRHAAKPAPIKEYDLPEVNLRMVVRPRPKGRVGERFVATLRYIVSPKKGKWVKVFAYGKDPVAAEIAVLFALQELNAHA